MAAGVLFLGDGDRSDRFQGKALRIGDQFDFLFGFK